MLRLIDVLKASGIFLLNGKFLLHEVTCWPRVTQNSRGPPRRVSGRRALAEPPHAASAPRAGGSLTGPVVPLYFLTVRRKLLFKNACSLQKCAKVRKTHEKES